MVAAMDAKKRAEKGAMQAADAVQSFADNVWKEMNNRVEKTGNAATMRAAEVAVTVVKLQRKAFDAAFDVLARVQERGEKLIEDQVDEASWLPNEGKDIIKEWSQALNDGRAEFQKVMDKSYDLIRKYFERVEKERQAWAKKKTASKGDGGEHAMAKQMGQKKAPVRRRAVAKK